MLTITSKPVQIWYVHPLINICIIFGLSYWKGISNNLQLQLNQCFKLVESICILWLLYLVVPLLLHTHLNLYQHDCDFSGTAPNVSLGSRSTKVWSRPKKSTRSIQGLSRILMKNILYLMLPWLWLAEIVSWIHAIQR